MKHLFLLNIGTKGEYNFRQNREIQIINIFSIVFGLLLPVSSYLNFQRGELFTSIIIAILVLLYFLNLLWNHWNWFLLSKIVLCFGITFIPIASIIMTGQIPVGQYLSVVTIGIVFATASIVLFDFKKEKFMYFFSILFYTLWILFSDQLIYYFSSPKPDLTFLIENYLYYKMPPILGFFAIAITLTAFKNTLYDYESENEAVKEILRGKNQALELRVEERTKELVEKNERIIQLGFITSHEIREPLTNIMSITQLLKMNPDDDEIKSLLPKLHDKSLRMDEVIQKMNMTLSQAART